MHYTSRLWYQGQYLLAVAQPDHPVQQGIAFFFVVLTFAFELVIVTPTMPSTLVPVGTVTASAVAPGVVVVLPPAIPHSFALQGADTIPSWKQRCKLVP